jgi:hypothetical protein
MPWLLYPQGRSPWYPLDRRLGGLQSQSGHNEGKIPSLHWDSCSNHPAHSQSLYKLSYPGSYAMFMLKTNFIKYILKMIKERITVLYKVYVT